MAYDPVKRHDYYMRTRQLKGFSGPGGGNFGNEPTSGAVGGGNWDKASSEQKKVAIKKVEDRLSQLKALGKTGTSEFKMLNALHTRMVNAYVAGLKTAGVSGINFEKGLAKAGINSGKRTALILTAPHRALLKKVLGK